MNLTTNENLKELAVALAKFHALVGPITPNKNVSYSGRKFEYADLGAIWGAIRKPLSDCGLSVVQTISDGQLTTMLLHVSGGHIVSSISLGIEPKVDHKQLGAAITYMRRYTLVTMLSLAADEDEAEDPNLKVPLTVGPETDSGKKIQIGQARYLQNKIGDDIGFLNSILKTYNISRLEELPEKHFNLVEKMVATR